MNKIHTENAPAAIGPYSQGYEVNGVVYTSGQLPVDPHRRGAGRHHRPGGAELQERGRHFGGRRLWV